MEETAAQAYALAGIVAVTLTAVLALVGFFMQKREHAFGRIALWIRAGAAVAVFVLMYLVGGVPINWMWAAVFAVVGAGLGYLSGRGSKIRVGDKGTPVIKRSPWPFLVSAISYVFAAAMVVFGTGGLFSVSLLVVLLGAMMQVGATVAETMQSQPTAPGQSAHPAEA